MNDHENAAENDLNTRVEKLERQNRSMRITLSFLMLVVAGAVLMGGAAQNAEKKSIEVEQIVVKDRAGNKRVVIGNGVTIGAGVTIGKDVTIGNNVTIMDGVVIPKGTVLTA